MDMKPGPMAGDRAFKRRGSNLPGAPRPLSSHAPAEPPSHTHRSDPPQLLPRPAWPGQQSTLVPGARSATSWCLVSRPCSRPQTRPPSCHPLITLPFFPLPPHLPVQPPRALGLGLALPTPTPAPCTNAGGHHQRTQRRGRILPVPRHAPGPGTPLPPPPGPPAAPPRDPAPTSRSSLSPALPPSPR